MVLLNKMNLLWKWNSLLNRLNTKVNLKIKIMVKEDKIKFPTKKNSSKIIMRMILILKGQLEALNLMKQE